MGCMKIKVFTLAIDNYFPELTKLSIPTIRTFAQNMGAEFEVIRERKLTLEHPDLPVTYEKLQVYDRFDEEDLDYAIIVDADMLLNPALPNPLTLMREDEVGVWLEYDHSELFEQNLPFPDVEWRDRALVTNYLVVPASKKDILRPLHPSAIEKMLKFCERPFIFDEFMVTYRLSQSHMKGTQVVQVVPDPSKIWHGNVTSGEKPQAEVLKEAALAFEKMSNIRNVTVPLQLPTYLNLKNRTTSGVMLGVWNGEFAHHFGQTWKGRIYGIDTWGCYQKQPPHGSMLEGSALLNASATLGSNVTLIRSEFSDVLHLFQVKSQDFVFIQGEFDGFDLDSWMAKIQSGGLLCGVSRDEYQHQEIVKFSEVMGIPLFAGSQMWAMEVP